MKELLKYNVDVNAQDTLGRTALHTASYGNHEIVKDLLNHHADTNIQKYDGSTALMLLQNTNILKM